MGNIVDVLCDFAETSSAHGFIHIRERTGLTRLLWILAVLGAWAMSAYQTYCLVGKFLSYPTASTISITYDESAEFPLVTICSENPVRLSNLSQLSPSLKKLVEQYSKSAQLKFNDTENITMTSPTAAYADIRQAILTAIYNSPIEAEATGHQIERFILSCTYGSQSCSVNDFYHFQHGSYGNCYTFDSKHLTNLTFPGDQFGLILELNAEKYEFLPILSSSIGFRVMIHGRNTIPFLEDDGFSISAGFSTSIGVQLQEINRLDRPYNPAGCISPEPGKYSNQSITYLNASGGDPMYTDRACWKTCYYKKLIDLCGCVDFSSTKKEMIEDNSEYFQPAHPELFHNPDWLRACQFVEKDGVTAADQECFSENFKHISVSCSNECLPSCVDKLYNKQKSATLWPTADYVADSFDSWAKQGFVKAMFQNSPPLVKSAIASQALSLNSTAAPELYSMLKALGIRAVGAEMFAASSELAIEAAEAAKAGRRKRQLNLGALTNVTNLVEPASNLVEPVSNLVEPVSNLVEPVANLVAPVVTLVKPVVNLAVPVLNIVGNVLDLVDGLVGPLLGSLLEGGGGMAPMNSPSAAPAATMMLQAFQQNCVQLKVFYRDLNLQVIDEKPVYDIQSFLISVGGIFGLFIGLSLVSIFEFLVLFKDLLCPCWHKQ